MQTKETSQAYSNTVYESETELKDYVVKHPPVYPKQNLPMHKSEATCPKVKVSLKVVLIGVGIGLMFLWSLTVLGTK